MKAIYLLILVFLFTEFAYAQPVWDIPDPDELFHPGASHAPASDPRTYPDESAYQVRRDSLVADLAAYNIWAYRSGYFASGNDPGKRVPAHAAARLILDPQDQDAIKIMNDDRSYKEHYHFAAVNWARYLPVFKPSLTLDTFIHFSQRAAGYSAYTHPSGTENHKVMSFTSGLVLAEHIDGKRIGNMTIENAQSKLKNMLKYYVRGLYTAGQGEWDSATYMIFDINGLLNIYDFSTDEECRLLAKAALDWMFTVYALKYTDGVFCGPIKRGFAKEAAAAKTDEAGWLWWGTENNWYPQDMSYHYVTFHSFTTGYRPNKVICDLAKKNLPDLPLVQYNSKPNYWFGQGNTPIPHQFRETVFATKHYTMGSLLKGYAADVTRFQLVTEGQKGGLVFTGGSPIRWNPWNEKYELRYEKDGTGLYDQSFQHGPAFICISYIPAVDALHQSYSHSFFNLPLDTTAVSDPVQKKGWWIIRADSTFIGLFPLVQDNNKIEFVNSFSRREQRYTLRRFYFHGSKTGFILQTADMDSFQTRDDFSQALLARTEIDTSNFKDSLKVVYKTLDGTTVRMQYQIRKDYPQVHLYDQPVQYDNFIHQGGYVSQKNGILTVNNGYEGFTIDFSGELPVYSDWKVSRVDEQSAEHSLSDYKLYQNHPNPFNSTTRLDYALSKGGKVRIVVFNVLGQKIKTLVKKTQTLGTFSVHWDGKDQNGVLQPSGIYFYQLEVADRIYDQKQMLFLK